MWVKHSALGDVVTQDRIRRSPARPAVATLRSLPNGTSGIIETLKYMRQMVRDAVRAPDQYIRSKALDLVAALPPRQWSSQVKALQQFVRDDIRYVHDPVDVELVQTPERTLEVGQGDCDDKATLLAALLTTIGHPARFVALAFNGDGFSHVIVETLIGDDWVPLETIIDKPMGWYPSGVTKRYELNI